nr:MAG TPA: hypothetical protein [Caudoviricetes sp.]
MHFVYSLFFSSFFAMFCELIVIYYIFVFHITTPFFILHN